MRAASEYFKERIFPVYPWRGGRANLMLHRFYYFDKISLPFASSKE